MKCKQTQSKSRGQAVIRPPATPIVMVKSRALRLTGDLVKPIHSWPKGGIVGAMKFRF